MGFIVDVQKHIWMTERPATTVAGDRHGLYFEDFIIHGALQPAQRF